MSFYTSLSGLQAMQNDMNVISHNLANVATTGFKKSRTEFADVIASNISTSPTKMVGSGVVVKANRQQFGEGTFQSTSNSLDLAVSGEGFFAVKTASAGGRTVFTRNGGFQVDKSRFVVDAQGSNLQVYPVDSSGAITARQLRKNWLSASAPVSAATAAAVEAAVVEARTIRSGSGAGPARSTSGCPGPCPASPSRCRRS